MKKAAAKIAKAADTRSISASSSDIVLATQKPQTRGRPKKPADEDEKEDGWDSEESDSSIVIVSDTGPTRGSLRLRKQYIYLQVSGSSTSDGFVVKVFVVEVFVVPCNDHFAATHARTHPPTHGRVHGGARVQGEIPYPLLAYLKKIIQMATQANRDCVVFSINPQSTCEGLFHASGAASRGRSEDYLISLYLT